MVHCIYATIYLRNSMARLYVLYLIPNELHLDQRIDANCLRALEQRHGSAPVDVPIVLDNRVMARNIWHYTNRW